MLRIIFGLSLVIQKLLVSGNQLTLIPLQTCPHTCSQNAYQAPVNVPLSLQQPNLMQQTPTLVIQQPTNNQPFLLQQPMNNNQPYYIPQTPNVNQLSLNQQPANNNQFYPQPVTLPNELAAPVYNNQPIQNNQAMNPLANQLNQLYMNKLMSNPAVQTILDPAANKFMANPTIQTIVDPIANLYGPRRIEIPRQPGIEKPRTTNQIPYHFPNADNVPHIINNYYVLPAEYFEKEAGKGGKHQNPHKREKDGHRRPTHDKQRRRHNQDSDEFDPEVRRKLSYNHRRENHGRSEVTHDTEQRYSEEERDGHKKRRNPNRKHYSPEMDRERPGDHSKGKSEQFKEKHHVAIERTHVNQRPYKPEIHRPSIIIKIKERPKQTSSENCMLKTDSSESRSVEKVEQIPKRFNISKNSNDEAIIQEFNKKIPAIPEEVVRKLLSYLKRQLRKQQLGHPSDYNPNANFPLRYEQLFPNFNLHEQYDHWRRPNRRHKVKPIKSNSISGATDVESTTNYESIIAGPTTTEIAETINPIEVATEFFKPMKSKERDQKPISETTHRPNSEPDIEISETTTTYSKLPELGTEDTVLDVSNGIIDDYYPDFTNDRSYFESEEVYNVRNMRDNRYYYTTDRNYEPRKSPFINSHKTNKPKYIHTILEDSIEDVIRKPIETETESTTLKYNTEEELQFRTPPTLESPDFITKQIVKENPGKEIHKHLSYKSSTYSDAKNPTSNDVKNRKITNNSRKIKPDSIETVYAHSKVIKYGKPNEESSENATPVVTYYLPDNMQYEEDGKTIVIAKSIPADHFW